MNKLFLLLLLGIIATLVSAENTGLRGRRHGEMNSDYDWDMDEMDDRGVERNLSPKTGGLVYGAYGGYGAGPYGGSGGYGYGVGPYGGSAGYGYGTGPYGGTASYGYGTGPYGGTA